MQTWLLNARSLWSVSEKEAGSSPNQFLLPFAMERLKAFSSSKRNKKKLRDIYVTVSYLNKWDLQNQENMTKNMDSYSDPSFWLLPKLPTWTKLSEPAQITKTRLKQLLHTSSFYLGTFRPSHFPFWSMFSDSVILSQYSVSRSRK